MERLNDVAFEEIVEEEGQTCVVVFFRKTCHVCQAVHEKLNVLEAEYPDIPFYEIDAEVEQELLSKFHLKGVPHVLFFKNGELYKCLSGDHEEDEYADLIENLL